MYRVFISAKTKIYLIRNKKYGPWLLAVLCGKNFGRSRACACVVSNSFDLYILLELAPGFDLASFRKNVTESRTFFPKTTVSWLPLKVTNATASQFLLRNSRTLLYTIVSLCLPQNSATCYYILSFNFCGPLMQKDETKLKLFFWASNVLFV